MQDTSILESRRAQREPVSVIDPAGLGERPFLNRKESAAFLNENGFPISFGQMQKLASVGGGPVYRIFGNKALYRPDDLIFWAQQKISDPISSTSEKSGR